MKQVVWDENDRCYYEIEPVWNGTLARQAPEEYSLLGEGWMTKEPLLGQHKWALESGTYVSQKEARNIKAADPFVLNPGTAGPVYVGPCSTCGKQVIGEKKCASCRRRSGSHAASTGRKRRLCVCGRPCSRRAQRCKVCAQAGRSMRAKQEPAA